MNRVEELLKQLCPDGVEFKELNDIAEISNIGVDKKIIKGEKSVMLLNYMDVYRNKYLKKEHLTMQVTASDRKIDECFIKKGDIYITPTSETIDDIGHAGVAIEDVPNGVYSYHIMRLRLNEVNLTTSFFISYLFDSNVIQKQISKSAVGITRYGVSKTKFAKFQIPIPPLPIQQEIVSILDKFTQLGAELEAELEERKRQYEYYRDQLLQVDDQGMMKSGVKAEWKRLGDVTTLITKGTTPKSFKQNGVSFIKTEAFDGTRINKTKLSYVDEVTHDTFLKRSILETNDILFTIAGATIGKSAIVTEDVLPANTNQALAIIRLTKDINLNYIFYILRSDYMKTYITQKVKSSAQPNLNLRQLNDFPIPIPPLTEQNRIVSILDKFDTLVNDTKIGLPAEIAARQKQYEYYRAKLLDFKEKQ